MHFDCVQMIVFSFQPGVTLLGRAAAGALSCPGALSAQQISILSHGTQSSLEMQPKTKILPDFSPSLGMDEEIRLLGGEQHPLLSARTSPAHR